MPTAGVLCLHFQTEHWAEVKQANAEFYFFDSPKNER